LLVFGQKYTFTNLEIKKLEKKFNIQFFIEYTQKTYNEVVLEIKTLLNENDIKIIVLNTEKKVPNELISFLTKLQFEKNIKIITIEHFLEKYLEKCYIPNDYTDLSFLENIKPYSNFQYIQKRTIDYLSILVLYIITFPILIYTRKRIKKESPGTSMFKQLRVGLNNKEFKCIKFRSMYLDAEKRSSKLTQENDQRVFKFGDIIRKTRIDELPQMINVLKGDMHLIGPRPEWKICVKEYEKEIPYYQERHLVRPGITGWAQVNYPYGANVEDAKQKLMYDLYYIKYWSFLLELRIIWKTIIVVLERKGL